MGGSFGRAESGWVGDTSSSGGKAGSGMSKAFTGGSICIAPELALSPSDRVTLQRIYTCGGIKLPGDPKIPSEKFPHLTFVSYLTSIVHAPTSCLRQSPEGRSELQDPIRSLPLLQLRPCALLNCALCHSRGFYAASVGML